MTGKHHLIAGVVTGACCTASIIIGRGAEVDAMDFLIAGCSWVTTAVGSLFPDIDTNTSKMGKKMRITSTVANKMFGHRGFLHSPLFVFCIFLLGGLLFKRVGIPEQYSPIYYCFAIGMLSHLACDLTTKGGIPLLYPFVRNKFNLSPMKSGSKWEPVMLFFVCLLIVVISTLFIFNGTYI